MKTIGTFTLQGVPMTACLPGNTCDDMEHILGIVALQGAVVAVHRALADLFGVPFDEVHASGSYSPGHCPTAEDYRMSGLPVAGTRWKWRYFFATDGTGCVDVLADTGEQFAEEDLVCIDLWTGAVAASDKVWRRLRTELHSRKQRMQAVSAVRA